MKSSGDPIGLAIQEFTNGSNDKDIVVECDICEEDVIPVEYLFRSYEDMPDIEKFALSQVDGSILDVGAGAGCHSIHLKNKGFNVTAVETSPGACQHMTDQGINVVNNDILNYTEQRFDTILLLMNGIGIAGSLLELKPFLLHLKSLLNENGKILCDSSNIGYMYMNEDGSMWIDLNSSYYGELKYKMTYRDQDTGWFDWLFIDPDLLTEEASKCGLDTNIILDGENGHFLAELKPSK